MTPDASAVATALAELGPVRVYLVEYRLTHGYAHLRLTSSGYHDHVGDVYLVGCSHICGPTDGGPWTLAVSREDDVLVVAAGDLVIRCSRVSFSRADSARPA